MDSSGGPNLCLKNPLPQQEETRLEMSCVVGGKDRQAHSVIPEALTELFWAMRYLEPSAYRLRSTDIAPSIKVVAILFRLRTQRQTFAGQKSDVNYITLLPDCTSPLNGRYKFVFSCDVTVFFLFVKSCGIATMAKSNRSFVAVVTGANKGIGLQVARKLCEYVKEFDENSTGVVYVGSRSVSRGIEAVQNLSREFQTIPQPLELDVTVEESVENAVTKIKQEHGAVDALVLNAGIAFQRNASESPGVQYSETFGVNYFGVRRCLRLFMPIMKPSGRVVVQSSIGGFMGWEKTSPANRERLLNVTDVKELDDIANQLLELAKKDEVVAAGWEEHSYFVSKLLVTKLAQLEAKRIQLQHPGLLINSCCPGWCKSDMAGWERPPKTAEEGAEIPFLLCLLPRTSKISGQFIRDASYWTPIGG
eukprot:Gregarina_sp_Poly_1__10208@NODE_707_length_6679_cov_285_720357_g534_i0_p2_GENE_NODE_707_length_6679_cov_285_720357_g534_i0NODE_707_length_6679_cov_285_720357_g534_i0_p2_ORF_typecomplete_len420_score45_21adh_short/PF00106_25/2_2e34adh_short_C2/PF13561_6/1_4e23KR/PF08659_10/1_4e09Epimerase/PF01370_21/0_001_NODE_707_length_6679_cov_285_720357_g534_i04191678